MCGKEPWEIRLEIASDEEVDLYVTDRDRFVLEGHFRDRPVHRRALPRLLESLALWQGEPLCVVISAARVVHPTLGLGHAGDEWPAQTEWLAYMHIEQPAGGAGRAVS
jgi:hypothetical protein